MLSTLELVFHLIFIFMHFSSSSGWESTVTPKTSGQLLDAEEWQNQSIPIPTAVLLPQQNISNHYVI